MYDTVTSARMDFLSKLPTGQCLAREGAWQQPKFADFFGA
jgi:hypothetical protein